MSPFPALGVEARHWVARREGLELVIGHPRVAAHVDLPLKGLDGVALGLYDVVKGLEGASDDVLDVSPFVHSLKSWMVETRE